MIRGLAEHKVELGVPLCPCRFYEDKKAAVPLPQLLSAIRVEEEFAKTDVETPLGSGVLQIHNV